VIPKILRKRVEQEQFDNEGNDFLKTANETPTTD
jgi:hypothetical protein